MSLLENYSNRKIKPCFFIVLYLFFIETLVLHGWKLKCWNILTHLPTPKFPNALSHAMLFVVRETFLIKRVQRNMEASILGSKIKSTPPSDHLQLSPSSRPKVKSGLLERTPGDFFLSALFTKFVRFLLISLSEIPLLPFLILASASECISPRST